MDKNHKHCEICGDRIETGRFCRACDAEIDRRAKELAQEWQQREMVRRQWDLGAGRDDIWLRPGEAKRGYAFSWEEAAKFEEAKSGG